MSFIIIEGNITDEATLREFPSKRTGELVPISNATVAVNDRRYNAETEQWVDTGKTFYEVTVTGTEAIHFAATAAKGARVIVAGNVYVEEYRDNEGNQRSRRRISADHHGLSSKFAAATTRQPANTSN
ncbi:single-strand DNA-binding protein [Jatrophihabitans sp. GAS493]|uniref:single-stranded DNA-binding protein n=1 Tax=Jatrophihabitans sp. GAS493 TaxID=1907575 RepID=UPI000BB8A813|nr:single-stranded DNA-binding protein [Jatrophihabitans sp. GAS493]SOD72882.1 single-strand DNA-binding protein [Jatrophihabitans sp. GAS493]